MEATQDRWGPLPGMKHLHAAGDDRATEHLTGPFQQHFYPPAFATKYPVSHVDQSHVTHR